MSMSHIFYLLLFESVLLIRTALNEMTMPLEKCTKWNKYIIRNIAEIKIFNLFPKGRSKY